jgi:adenosylcobinamide kinase/adenosylcobinamide-phosphate guanylyltransferase
MPLVVVTGPVRSGKSTFAQVMASQSGRRVTVVATGRCDPADAEWAARIARHRRERPTSWRTVETAGMPLREQCLLYEAAGADECLVVDALGTWLADRLGAHSDAIARDPVAAEQLLETEARQFGEAMLASRALCIAVCEQVGWEVVPVAPSARLFRDVLGRMVRRLAADAESAYLVVAGYAIDVKRYGVLVAAGDAVVAAEAVEAGDAVTAGNAVAADAAGVPAAADAGGAGDGEATAGGGSVGTGVAP